MKGGYAFPRPPLDKSDRTAQEGMKLRDYFAIRIYQSIISTSEDKRLAGFDSMKNLVLQSFLNEGPK